MFIRRVVALAVVVSVLIGATAALAATPGTYRGGNSDGNALRIVVASGGKSGTFHFCGQRIGFKISNNKFSAKKGTVSATGRFKSGRVSGTIKPSSCSGSRSTYSLKRR